MLSHFEKYIAQSEARLYKEQLALLPDICTIQTTASYPVISSTGVQTRPVQFRLYKGDVLIPCRIDTSRAFRPERYPNQEVNANEYVFHIPKEVTLLPNDKILILGRMFEARKLIDLPTFRITNEALIVELQGQY